MSAATRAAISIELPSWSIGIEASSSSSSESDASSILILIFELFGSGSSTISSITIGPRRAGATTGGAFFDGSEEEEEEEEETPSSSSMATRRIAARAVFSRVSFKVFFAKAVSRTSSASLGSPSFVRLLASITAHSSKSRSATDAASCSFASSAQAPRRSSALKCSGSSANAASQSRAASDHRRSFMYAAARFANGAGLAASSAMDTSYASIAERYSRALNSSLPFSFSRAAAQRRSRAGASRKPARSFSRSARVAPETERSSAFDSASRFAASANTPPTPCPSIFCSAAFKSASVGMPSRSAEDELEGLGFPATSPVAVTVARVAPRTGAPAFLSRGANAAGSESARASSAFAAEDHASRSATNARTSASRSARASAEVLPDCDPRDARRAFATCAVVGNPSSLNVGDGTNRGWDEDVSCRVSVCQSVSVSVSVACVPSRLVTARWVSGWRSAREKGRRACFASRRRTAERRRRVHPYRGSMIVRSDRARSGRTGGGEDALHVLRELVQLVHVRHRVDIIEPDVVELLALVFSQRDGHRPRHDSVDLGTLLRGRSRRKDALDRFDRESAVGHERARPARGLGAASRSCAVTEAVFANTRVVPASARVGALLVVNVKARDRRARFLEQSTARREFAPRGGKTWTAPSSSRPSPFCFFAGHDDWRRATSTPRARGPSERDTSCPCASHRRARRPLPRSFARCPSPRRSQAPRPRRTRRRSRADSAGAAASEAAARAPRARRSP